MLTHGEIVSFICGAAGVALFHVLLVVVQAVFKWTRPAQEEYVYRCQRCCTPVHPSKSFCQSCTDRDIDRPRIRK